MFTLHTLLLTLEFLIQCISQFYINEALLVCNKNYKISIMEKKIQFGNKFTISSLLD